MWKVKRSCWYFTYRQTNFQSVVWWIPSALSADVTHTWSCGQHTGEPSYRTLTSELPSVWRKSKGCQSQRHRFVSEPGYPQWNNRADEGGCQLWLHSFSLFTSWLSWVKLCLPIMQRNSSTFIRSMSLFCSKHKVVTVSKKEWGRCDWMRAISISYHS